MSSYKNFGAPNITVNEIDLTGGVTGSSATVGAIAGNFGWGPVEEIQYIGDEKSLVRVFGTPTVENNVDFLSAVYFSKRSNNLVVVRAAGTGAFNAYSNPDATNLDILIKNIKQWDLVSSTVLALNPGMAVARYPGAAGNSLGVSICIANDIDAEEAFSTWDFRSLFAEAPATSSFAQDAGATNDEVHVVVYDVDGKISGVKGTILEKYEFLSLAKGAKLDDGSANNIVDVINKKSAFIYVGNIEDTIANANATAVNGFDFVETAGTPLDFTYKTETFANGSDSTEFTTANYINAYDLFKDKWLDVDLLIAPSMALSEDHVTLVNYITGIAAEKGDCIAIASPSRESILGVDEDSIGDTLVALANQYSNSSYLFADDMFFKVYDKYNDVFVHIPAASSTAGLFAFTDENFSPWYSPAGPKRGVYDASITTMSWRSTDVDRDRLYNAGVNSVINTPNGSIQLNGDKTKLVRNSAFSRINVRRLFIEIKKVSKSAASNVMFEFNDEFTRSQFVNDVEPQLRAIKGDRGIYDFRIICDETNNDANVIDDNAFVASIFVKPARSINWVEVNMVAVRTGVDFAEVAGTV